MCFLILRISDNQRVACLYASPVSYFLCLHFPKAMLLGAESYSFGLQNLCFYTAKPMLLQAKRIAFANPPLNSLCLKAFQSSGERCFSDFVEEMEE